MPIEFIREPDGLPGWKVNKICPDAITYTESPSTLESFYLVLNCQVTVPCGLGRDTAVKIPKYNNDQI